MRSTLLVTWGVFIEFLRRRDFYIMLILLALYLTGVVAMRIIGVEDVYTARFLMSLGLSLSASLAAILTAVFTARELPDEFENRTIYPMLAKPISRFSLLQGKRLGVLTIGVLTLWGFSLLAWLPVPNAPDQQFSQLLLVLVLRSLALWLLADFVMLLSIRLSAVVSASLGLALWFVGSPVINMVVREFDSLPSLQTIMQYVLSILPDFSIFDFTQNYVQGLAPAVTSSTLGGVLLYFVGLAILYNGGAIWFFSRRRL
ncbi:ABC transporter permease [bacterium]|nr:ABC transporter permease [bacterium]